MIRIRQIMSYAICHIVAVGICQWASYPTQAQEFIPNFGNGAGNGLNASLTAMWRFEEGSTGDALDSSSNARTMTANAAVADGGGLSVVGLSRSFSSTTTTDYFYRTNQTGFNPGTNAFTVTAWAYFDDGGGSVTGDMTIMSNGDYGNSTMSWWLELDHGTPDAIRVFYSTNGVYDFNNNIDTEFSESGGVVSGALWYFIAFRWDGATLHLSTTPITSAAPSTDTTKAFAGPFYTNTTEKVTIADLPTTDHLHDMGGNLDEIAVWAAYLSDCQIGKLFNAKAGIFSQPYFDLSTCVP